MNYNNADLKLTAYAELVELATEIAEGGVYPLIAIVGRGGTGKTETITSTLENEGVEFVHLNKARLTAFELYKKLYDNQDKLIVIDDCDSLWRNPDTMLKALAETKDVKTISWFNNQTNPKPKTRVDEDGEVVEDNTPDYPPTFTTTSEVVILANNLGQLTQDMEAMLDRGTLVWFDPTNDEIINYTATWLGDNEIIEFAREWSSLAAQPSCRDMWNAKKKKQGTGKLITWQKVLLGKWRVSEMTTVRDILNDPSYKTEGERVAAFIAKTGKSRAEWYRDMPLINKAFKPRPKSKVNG